MTNKIILGGEVIVYDNELALPESDRELLLRARTAAADAYAPYSQFRVGAAVLMADNRVFCASNQENAAYPSGMCAERAALFYASANSPGVAVKAIAITALSGKIMVNRPVPPCGACRQAIAEYEHLYSQPVKLILAGESGEVYTCESVSTLLPLSFNTTNLEGEAASSL